MELRAILCCEFEKTKGPIVKCSDPPDALASQFSLLGRYFIPEKSLSHKVVSVQLDSYRLLGVPVYIDDAQYERNCFQFCILLVTGQSDDYSPYRDAALHLATAFHTVEVEAKLLSNKQHVEDIKEALKTIRSQLNGPTQECHARVGGGSYCICFKVRPKKMSKIVRDVYPEHVPIPLVDTTKIQRAWQFEPDQSLLRLLPLIDGLRTTRQITELSGLDEARVRTCLRHLLHFGLIEVVDQIHLESRYRLTSKFHIVFESPSFRSEAPFYVTMGRHSFISGSVEEEEFLGLLQRLYADMNGWSGTVADFKEKHIEEMRENGISLRHFLAFGLLRKILATLHDYPVIHSRELQDSPIIGPKDLTFDNARQGHNAFTLLCDGSTHMDKINTILGDEGSARESLSSLRELYFVVRK